MDGFTYVNIFDTKGIEYLVIIAFLLLFIPFSLLLDKKVKISREIRKVFSFQPIHAMNIPQGLYYSQHHTWTHLERTGLAKVGLDHLMHGIAGDMKINPLKYSNEMVKKGDVLAEIGINGKKLRVYSPITGRIISNNPHLADNPEESDAPVHQNWICEIKPDKWKMETSSYFLADEATAWLKSELDRLKDFLAHKTSQHSPQFSAVILQDGGEIARDVINDLPAEVWQDFQREFLDPV